MGLNYIPPKNMITEEYIGNTVPQGSVFLQPVVMGPKYILHYKDMVDNTTLDTNSDALRMKLPSYSALINKDTRLITGGTYPYKIYAEYSDHVYELTQTPWGGSTNDIDLDRTEPADMASPGTYGMISLKNYVKAATTTADEGADVRARIAKTYGATIDLDNDTAAGDKYIKLVKEVVPTSTDPGLRVYEYYDVSTNFTSLAQASGIDFYIAAGRGSSLTQRGPIFSDASTPGLLMQIAGIDSYVETDHTISLSSSGAVSGSKVYFAVQFPIGWTNDGETHGSSANEYGFYNDPIANALVTAALSENITELTITKADTLDGSNPLIYLQIAAGLPEYSDPSTFGLNFYVSYRELDLSYGDKVYTITRDEVETYFPYNSIADKLGKMVYLMFESGSQIVNFISLPYDEEYENTDTTALNSALDMIGESQSSYYIVNYDYSNTSHVYLKTFIDNYAARDVSKPMTAIVSISLDKLGVAYDTSTDYDIANAISDYASNTINHRRFVLMWPDKVGMYSALTYMDDEFGELITDDTYGYVVEGPGMYAAAAYAGLRAAKTPRQGLTNSIVPGLAYVRHSSDMFKKTLATQPLNIIAGGGVTVLYQETPTSFVTVYHQLSTKMDDTRAKEFNKTVCYDYAAYYLLSISPKRGTQSWTEPVIGYEVGLMHAGCKQLVKAGILTYAEVGKPTLSNDELDIPIVVESPTPDNYKVINLRIRG